uniref:NS3 n=1 Tax=uncultured densovirus TaxID=748192 RepID=A0A7L7YQN6_9VIRU|nr:NS3 [uncultured densovirus]
MCYAKCLDFYDIKGEFIGHVALFDDDLEAFETMSDTSTVLFGETEEEEDIPVDEDDYSMLEPWQANGDDNFWYYLDGLKQQTDKDAQYLFKFYQDNSPDYAVPLMREGLLCSDFIYFNTLMTNDLNNSLPILFKDNVTIHLVGDFYMNEVGDTRRYCGDCCDADAVKYKLHNIQGENWQLSHKIEYNWPEYFCTDCDKFLFKVEDYDEICCDYCQAIMGYSEDGGKTSFKDYNVEIMDYFNY